MSNNWMIGVPDTESWMPLTVPPIGTVPAKVKLPVTSTVSVSESWMRNPPAIAETVAALILLKPLNRSRPVRLTAVCEMKFGMIGPYGVAAAGA